MGYYVLEYQQNFGALVIVRSAAGSTSLIACRSSVCSSVLGKCLVMSNSTLFVNGTIHQVTNDLVRYFKRKTVFFDEFFVLVVCSISGSSSVDDPHSRPDPHIWRPHVPKGF